MIEAENEDSPSLEYGEGFTPEDEEAAAIPLEQVTGRVEQPFVIPRGKYKGLVLPRMVGVKPSKLDEVNAIRGSILNDPAFPRQAHAIAAAYVGVRREVEDLATQLEEAKMRLTAIMLIMTEQFETEDTLSLRLRDIGTIRVQPEPHAIVLDKAALQRWCRAHGYEDLMVVPWGTINRITKDMLMAAQGEPDGVTAFMQPKVVFTKEK